jgi:hypothetical protein
MKKSVLPSCVVALVLIIGLCGCEKRSGEALVLVKEHIDAALPIGETPNSQSAPGPDEQLRPIAHDEIAVDGYVMKPEVRGTSRDPRALKHEQWLVTVRMLGGRTIRVHADQARWQNCAKTIESKSPIARANIPELFGTQRLTEDRAGFRFKMP